MISKASEASAKAGPGVLLGGEPGSHTKSTAPAQPDSHTEFELQAACLADRFGLSAAVAGVVLSHLRMRRL